MARLGLETKGLKTLGLVLNLGTCLVLDENFWDSLVPVAITAEILLTLSFCGVVSGAQSLCCQTQPCVEVRLGF